MPARKRMDEADQPVERVRRRAAPAAIEGADELEAFRKQVVKERGENTMVTATRIPDANRIPTGAFTVDFALLGGLAEGCAAMLYGLESSGKTTMAMKAVAEFLRKHPTKVVVWVDTENMFDRGWAASLGCDLTRIEVVQPETGEEAVDLIDGAMGVLAVGMIVLDSIPGCVPKTIVDRSAEDQTMAVLARLMGIMCSKILTKWNREKKRNHVVTFLPLNQFRMKVGLVFGDPRTSPGGRQINHLPTTKIEVRNKEVMGKDSRDNEVVEYNDHTFIVTKAKHGASIRNGQFQMTINPEGESGLPQGSFDDYKTVVTFAKRMGLLEGGGGKYRIPNIADETWAKHEDIVEWLKTHPHKYAVLRANLIGLQRSHMNLPVLPPDGYLCGVWCAGKESWRELADMAD